MFFQIINFERDGSFQFFVKFQNIFFIIKKNMLLIALFLVKYSCGYLSRRAPAIRGYFHRRKKGTFFPSLILRIPIDNFCLYSALTCCKFTIFYGTILNNLCSLQLILLNDAAEFRTFLHYSMKIFILSKNATDVGKFLPHCRSRIIILRK